MIIKKTTVIHKHDHREEHPTIIASCIVLLNDLKVDKLIVYLMNTTS